MVPERLCVYCGSSTGDGPRYDAAARELGTLLATRGIGVVYGGGNIGLMGTLAEAAMEAGGEVVGVIPQALMDREVGKRDITDLHVVGSMHERKQLMADLADGFVALPGGIGTLEELIEVFTWTQLGVHHKPCAVVDVAGFYTGLIGFLDHAVAQGFLAAEHRRTLVTVATVAELLPALELWVPGEVRGPIDAQSV
jgi:uncharacterized protein (TIGR00730 family)